MVKKTIVVVLGVVVALGIALALYARSVLASDNVRVTLESQLSKWFGQPVSIGRAGASIFPRVALQLSDVSVGSPAAVTAKSVSVSTGLGGLFSRRIEDAEVVLSDGRVLLPDALRLRTAADEAAGADDGEGGAITIASVRVISLRNVEFATGNTAMRFDMASALSGDTLDVSQLSVKSARTELGGKGAFTSISRLQGAFTVSAEQLDLDELLNLSSGFTTPVEPERAGGGSGIADTMRIALGITAKAGVLTGYEFSDLTTKLEATPSRIELNPLALRTFGGTLNGTLGVDASSATPVLNLKGKIADLDVAKLAEQAGAPGSITGRLGGVIDLTAMGTVTDTLVRSAKGTATAAITNGTIPGLDMVRTIVLAFGKPSGAPPQGSGSAFTRLGGNFATQHGVVRTDNLTFESRDFDMRGRASLAVATGAVDATTDVILSKELTAQAGTDLRRYAQSEGRIIMPARITGTLGQPAITLDLAAATRRALENELKRRGKSLLDDLFRRKKGGGYQPARQKGRL